MEFKIERDSEILAHHGILGQKWGIRRYQNEDGSLTEAGKQRYQDNESYGEYRDTRSFAERHKKALVIGGIAAAVAIAAGIKYVNGRQEKRIDEIDKITEKMWKKNVGNQRKFAANQGMSLEDLLTSHKTARADRINELFKMDYSDLANEAKRLKYMNRRMY